MGDMNGMDYYVVYWYPTIFHRGKKRRDKVELEFVDISDNSDLPLKLKKEEVGNDLKYTLLFGDTGKEIPFHLTHDGERRNGFTVYKYDRVKLRKDLKEAIKEGLVKAIKEGKISFSTEGYLGIALDKYDDAALDKYIDKIFISCYHSAKELYHKHEIQNGSDGRLKAYLKDPVTKEYLTVKPDINNPNHDAIRFFIEQYESLFSAYAQNISDDYSKIKASLSIYIKNNRETPSSKDEAIAILNDLDDLASTVEHVPKPLEKDDTFSSLLSGESNLSDEAFRKSIKEIVDKEFEEEAKRQRPQKEYSGKNLEELKEEIWERENQVQYYLVDCLNSIQITCGNAMTEYNYCKSLLESKYNTEYKYDLQLTDDELSLLGKGGDDVDEELNAKDLRRKSAFNIRNSIRYIVEVRSKCDTWESEITRYLVQKVDRMQQTAEKSRIQSEEIEKLSLRLGEESVKLGQQGRYLGKLSVGLGILSVVLAIIGFFLPEIKPCNSKSNHPERHLDTTQALVEDSTSTTQSEVTDSCVFANAKSSVQ